MAHDRRRRVRQRTPDRDRDQIRGSSRSNLAQFAAETDGRSGTSRGQSEHFRRRDFWVGIGKTSQLGQQIEPGPVSAPLDHAQKAIRPQAQVHPAP